MAEVQEGGQGLDVQTEMARSIIDSLDQSQKTELEKQNDLRQFVMGSEKQRKGVVEKYGEKRFDELDDVGKTEVALVAFDAVWARHLVDRWKWKNNPDAGHEDAGGRPRWLEEKLKRNQELVACLLAVPEITDKVVERLERRFARLSMLLGENGVFGKQVKSEQKAGTGDISSEWIGLMGEVGAMRDMRELERVGVIKIKNAIGSAETDAAGADIVLDVIVNVDGVEFPATLGGSVKTRLGERNDDGIYHLGDDDTKFVREGFMVSEGRVLKAIELAKRGVVDALPVPLLMIMGGKDWQSVLTAYKDKRRIESLADDFRECVLLAAKREELKISGSREGVASAAA